MKPDTQERPDFENEVIHYALNLSDPNSRAEFENRITEACKFGANHYRKRIEELEAVLRKVNTAIQCSNMKNTILHTEVREAIYGKYKHGVSPAGDK